MTFRSLATGMCAVSAAIAALAVPGVGSAQAGSDPAHQPRRHATHHPVLFYASDGMRPDLMQRYAEAGQMPAYEHLLRTGVSGSNGLMQAFPPNTGVGWYSLATGGWPAQHGSTNNTFHDDTGPFAASTGFSAPDVLQADTVAASAERAGKQVAAVGWTGGANFDIDGPTVDYGSFFSDRGVLVWPRVDAKAQSAQEFGLSYQVADVAAASGWTGAPAGDLGTAPKQAALVVDSTRESVNPDRRYDLYIYDSRSDGRRAYDTVLVVPTYADKEAGRAVARLGKGDWADVKLSGDHGLSGDRAGQTADFYAKLVTLAPDLSRFKLYFTSVARGSASCQTDACAALPNGESGADNLEAYLANHAPGWVTADFAPLEARVIGARTYVEQGLELNQAYGDAVTSFVLGTLQPDTDLAMVGYSTTDEFSHQFLGLTTRRDPQGGRNPCYGDLSCRGRGDGSAAARYAGYIEDAYNGADHKLSLSRSLMPRDTDVVAGSDHGFAPAYYAINAGEVLHRAGLQDVAQPYNCGVADSGVTRAKGCWAGGTAQIYLNLKSRYGDQAPVTDAQYGRTQQRIVHAFRSLTDDAGDPVLKVLTKDQLDDVQGSDSLYPTRSGDVVVVARPPYQFDAPTTNKPVALSSFFGQHGYLPNTVDLGHGVNMHAVFVAAGPGIGHPKPLDRVRVVDVAPTVAHLLGVPAPRDAVGHVLRRALERGRGHRPGRPEACAPGVGFLGFSDALDRTSYGGTHVGGLSDLAYDRRRGVYYSVVDHEEGTPARFYTLRAPVRHDRLGRVRVVDVTTLRDAGGDPITGGDFEGIAYRRGDGLLVSSEEGPQILRFSLSGRLLGTLPVPARFLVAPAGQGQDNLTFESPSLTGDGHYLFTANEEPLSADGDTASGRHRVRILRYDRRGSGRFEPAAQFYYRTDANLGVSAIQAVSRDESLVLERGYEPGVGNTVRVYRASLRGAPDVSATDSLAGHRPVHKRLLVDVADCPASDAPNPQPQPNPLLDNFEGIAFGPHLRHGRRTLLLQSDNNYNDSEVTRLIALAVGRPHRS